MSDDLHKQERALMTIASVSLNPHMPLEKFYNPGKPKFESINAYRFDIKTTENS